MASYLAMMAIGEFDVDAYTADGLRFWDALDSDLSEAFAARSGEQFAWSQVADTSYKRLSRTISVPPEGRGTVLLDQPGDRAQLGLRLRRGSDRQSG